jgi:hypothetical protein
MSKKLPKFLSLLVIVALLATFGAGAALAQEMTGVPGDGPANAVMPSAGTVTIGPGQWQWYAIRSQVPVGVEESADDVVTDPRDATINAVLRTQSGKLDFDVWTADDLNNWINAEEFDPTGAGTPNEFIAGTPLTWQGSFETNKTLYLIVKNRTAQPANYTLNVTGNVTFPAHLALNPEAQPAQAAVAAAKPVESTGEMALTVDMPGEAAMGDSTLSAKVASDVSTPAMPPQGFVTIAPGEKQWYPFRSQVPVGVEEDSEAVVTDPRDATIDAVLRAPSGSVSFEVWSANDLNNWINGEEFEPTGAGTPNEFIAGEPLTWQGSFETNDTYYLVVTNRSSQPATYSLSITGNVSFPAANATAK